MVIRKQFPELYYFAPSIIVGKEGQYYYAMKYKDKYPFIKSSSVKEVVQSAINSTERGIVFVKGVEEPSGITYKKGVAVIYDTPYFYIRDLPELELITTIYDISSSENTDIARNVWAEEGMLYVLSCHTQELDIFDISDPSNPVHLSKTSLGHYPVNIAKRGKYLLISCGRGLKVVDVSNPKSPTIVTTLDLGSYIHGMFLKGDYLFGCMHVLNKFVILDVSNPKDPRKVSELSGETYFHGAHDVYVDDKYAYVANYLSTEAGQYGLTVVDVSNPYSPSVVTGVLESESRSYVTKYDKYLLVGGHDSGYALKILDVSDPTSPTLVKELTELGTEGGTGYWMDTYGKYVFILCKNAKKLAVLDMETLNVIDAYEKPEVHEYGKHVFVYGDLVFVSWQRTDGTYYYSCVDIYRIHHLTKPYWLNVERLRRAIREQRALDYSNHVVKKNSGVRYITGDGTKTTFTVDIVHELDDDRIACAITLDREGSIDKIYLRDADTDGFYERIVVQVTYATAPASGETVPIYWSAEVVKPT